MRWPLIPWLMALLLPAPVLAAPLTPAQIDKVCRQFAGVVAGIAVQRDAGTAAAEVKRMVRERLQGQELDWSFSLLDAAANDVYGRWARTPPKQVRTLWHKWCRAAAMTPEQLRR